MKDPGIGYSATGEADSVENPVNLHPIGWFET
jgi:hypothetical protein